MKKADVEEFYSRLQAANPEPKGELDWTNPFTLLVAVVLSAQATDVSVNKAKKYFKACVKHVMLRFKIASEYLVI